MWPPPTRTAESWFAIREWFCAYPAAGSAFEQLRESVRRSRSAAQQLQKVERGPLARQQRPGRSVDSEQDLIRVHCLALAGVPVKLTRELTCLKVAST